MRVDLSGSSGLVTTSTFTTIVNLVGEVFGTLEREELIRQITCNGLKIYIERGYLKKRPDGKYELTRKGVLAYYENKAYQTEVERVKKIIRQRWDIARI